MTLIEHAGVILNFLASRRSQDGFISEISNIELIERTTFRNASNYAVVYGQANSLIDLASLQAELPMIGRLVIFDRGEDASSCWANWQPFEGLLYYAAPRLKRWSESDIRLIHSNLQQGRPSALWKELEKQSESLLSRALVTAQSTLINHVEDYLRSRADGK